MIDFAKKKRHAQMPVRVICLSFLFIILAGAVLLMMPFSSKTGDFTSPLSALFTATSATCVTGLVVFDTWTHWTVFGQSVILMLIQLGGLGLVSFTTFFTLTVRGKLDLRNLRLAGEHMNFGDIIGIPSMLGTIIKATFICEGIGALILCTRFVPMFGAQGVFMSVFIAVSAYCNAGFDVFGFIAPYTNLAPFIGDWVIMLTVCMLIVFGGLGFIVFHDVLTSHKHGKRVHNLMLHSKIVITMTAFLIVSGAIAFLISEHNHTLKGLPVSQQVLGSLFSSITPRTAGFSVVDYAATSPITRLFTTGLMFIGASPGSTGGGVKTATIVVILMTVYSVMKGHEDTIIFKRRVEKSIVYKAMALVFFSLMLLTVAIVALAVLEPEHSIINLMFEAVSAFSTTGLSAAGSQNLSHASQVILIFLMYIGRVGPISFILTLSMRYASKDKDTTLPVGRIMVG